MLESKNENGWGFWILKIYDDEECYDDLLIMLILKYIHADSISQMRFLKEKRMSKDFLRKIFTKSFELSFLK